ncbi:MAG: hypothetical protein EA374_00145 [Acholeplasmatales bacterium]|nr:MAG: hypothetical protein EA374_00145 [Acholeplasmatales bacterium]
MHAKNMNRFITLDHVRKLPELTTVYTILTVLALLVGTVFVTTYTPRPFDYTHALYAYHEEVATVSYLFEADFLRDNHLLIETETYAMFYGELTESSTSVFNFAIKHDDTLYYLDAMGANTALNDIERCYGDYKQESDLETGLFIGYVLADYRLVEGVEVRKVEFRFDAEAHYEHSQPIISKLNYRYVFYENNKGIYRMRHYE